MANPRTAGRAQSAPPLKTDFGNWSVPTWECYGDQDSNACEPRWKSPEYPDPLYAISDQDWFLEVIWPRILYTSIVVFPVTALVGPCPLLWTFLLGMSVGLLISHFVNRM